MLLWVNAVSGTGRGSGRGDGWTCITLQTPVLHPGFHNSGNLLRSEVHGITGIILGLGITHTQLAFLH